MATLEVHSGVERAILHFVFNHIELYANDLKYDTIEVAQYPTDGGMRIYVTIWNEKNSIFSYNFILPKTAKEVNLMADDITEKIGELFKKHYGSKSK